MSGLSCALRLLEAGHHVEVWARARRDDTTSSIAAAIWYPYRAGPADKVLTWGTTTYRELERLSQRPETGVAMCSGVEVFASPVADPWWASAVPGFRRATRAELTPGSVDGYHLRVPVADMTRYLGWLEHEVMARGASIQARTVDTLQELHTTADVLVNCTGLGAREVADDPSVYGVRGQVQVVDAPDVGTFVIHDSPQGDGHETTYIIPRGSSVVLGGTADEYVEEAVVSDETTRAIRSRCAQLVPALSSARVVADKAGIRPCRPEVRLETEMVNGRQIIHNYGHGGAGVTLSWGCADDVVRLAGVTR